jgi:hypothetical protein
MTPEEMATKYADERWRSIPPSTSEVFTNIREAFIAGYRACEEQTSRTRDELLQAERDEMREMLEKVEWVDGRCPWCMRRYEHREYSDTVTDYDGNSVCIRRATGEHKPDCKLAKVLGR